MILPITESILRGELRPNLITETVSPEMQSLLMRQLRLTTERTNLIELEKDLIYALGNFTHVTEIYTKDKQLRNAISRLNRPAISSSYTRVYKSVLADILVCPEISTPNLKMYKTLLCLEKQRTIWALVELHSMMKDDRFVRPEVKSLLDTIKDYSKEVKSWRAEANTCLVILLQNMLTELYFSLILTFSSILYAHGNLDFDDDFDDFVFQWKGTFPTKEETEKYLKEKNRIQKENTIIQKANSITALDENEVQEKEKQPMNTAEKFLKDTQQYAFMKMPMIVALDSENEGKRRQKALHLIELMLESPAHAAAMLDYLGFYKWIKSKYEKNYTLTAYDKFCTKIVMGQEGEAFKNYRLSIKYDRDNYRKYHSWEYLERVKEEYQSLINNNFLDKDL